MIEVTDLHKQFGPVHALNGLSFVAPDGTITGLLGRNGAGKTTTLSIVCGLLEADGGSITVGRTGLPTLDRRRQLGALLDHQGLYSRLTTRENIAYFGRLHGLRGAKLAERVDAVIDQLELSPIADRRVGSFSQGERMKVALGRAIVHAPPHLLLDEPTNGLDIPTVYAFRELLRLVRQDGTCVIFSSHVLAEVRAICDQVVVVHRGCAVATGTANEVCRGAASESLEDAFLKLTGPEVSAL
jgi:sodium transport system ATP-binding protein